MSKKRYTHKDSLINYTNGWAPFSDYTYCSNPSDTITFEFRGTEIDLIFTKNHDCGNIMGSINGSPEEEVVTVGTGQMSKVWGVVGLSDRIHKITIRPACNKIVAFSGVDIFGEGLVPVGSYDSQQPEIPDPPVDPDGGGGTVDPSLPYFNFNGKDVPDFIKVKSVEFSVLPSLSVPLTNINGKFGVFESATVFGEKVISVGVILVQGKRSLFDLAGELAVFLKGNDWKLSKLTFQDLEGKYFMAKVQAGVDLSDLMVAGEGTIEFVVPNPVKYAEEEKIVKYTTNTFDVMNRGTHKVKAVMKFTNLPVCTFLKVKSVTTGKEFKVTNTFKAGDTLEVDFAKNVIKLNGKVNLSIFNIDSDWLELTEGNNSYIVETSVSTTFNSEVKFREMYL